MSPLRSTGISAKSIRCIVFVVSMSLTNSDGPLSGLLYVSLSPSGLRFNGGRSASYADSMNIALTSKKTDS